MRALTARGMSSSPSPVRPLSSSSGLLLESLTKTPSFRQSVFPEPLQPCSVCPDCGSMVNDPQDGLNRQLVLFCILPASELDAPADPVHALAVVDEATLVLPFSGVEHNTEPCELAVQMFRFRGGQAGKVMSSLCCCVCFTALKVSGTWLLRDH